MKSKLIAVVMLTTVGGMCNVWAAPICDGGTCTKQAVWDSSLNTFVDCGTDDNTCTCVNAQTGTTTYVCGCFRDTECSENHQCVNNKCKACKSCTNCNTTSWTAGNTGYQRRVYKTCNCDGVCNQTNEYRCAAGYYGSSTNGTSGCSRCPSSGSSSAGSTVITACYLPSGWTGTDSTGSYTYTANCYYSN